MVASVFDYSAIKRRMMELTGEIPSGNHFDMQGNKIAAPSIPSGDIVPGSLTAQGNDWYFKTYGMASPSDWPVMAGSHGQ